MRICIAGFYGWGNCGDEGILQAIIDSLGWENEYIVSTSLPYNMLNEYHLKNPNLEDVRHLYDSRTDFDIYLLGGGRLNFGYGWQQALAAMSSNKPCMNYGVAYEKDLFYHPKLHDLYKEFLSQFKAITVRDSLSMDILNQIDVWATVTMDPAINLKEQKTSCPKGMIAVCPRYSDFDKFGKPISNEKQVAWMVNRLKDCKDEVLLIPFSPKDADGHLRDLEVCQEISLQLGGVHILNVDGFHPREVKYAISQSKLVISGGRYHALVWAAAHKISYEVSPNALDNPKIAGFLMMHKGTSGDDLKEMEKQNVQIFKDMLANG